MVSGLSADLAYVYFLEKLALDRVIEKKGQKKAFDNIRELGIQGLIVIGGDGSFHGAYYLNKDWDVPTIGVPIANHDNNQHQPNENVRLGHLWQGIETFATLMLTGKMD